MEDCKGRLAVVIDNGTGVIKAGLAGQDKPLLVPTVIGCPKLPVVIPDSYANDDQYIGTKALKKRAILRLNYPAEHGVVKNWDEMENIYGYIYKELEVAPEDNPVLLTESPLNPNSNREKLAELMFEHFGVPALYIVVGALLSLYASDRCCGVVVDSGDGVTYAAPIYSGVLMENDVQRINVAGRDVTNYLARLLADSGNNFSTPASLDIVREAKEQICYVARNLEREEAKKRRVEVCYQLPDGQVLPFNSELFLAPEILFTPELIGHGSKGIGCLTYDSIMGSPEEDVRTTLACNIVLAGGSTRLPKFDRRLKRELHSLDKNGDYHFRIFSPSKRNITAWKGGSMLVCNDAFNDFWISKADYQERGNATLKGRRKFVVPCTASSTSH